MPVRVLLAGGGTGGHLFPALAVAEALRDKDAEILFVGTAGGVEAKIVPQHGFRIEYLPIAGFRRRRVLANLGLPLKVVASLVRSLQIILRFRPQAALGTGGYVCGPILAGAILARIPILLQEQNSYPGVTTRLLARFARQVFLNFEEAAQYLPRKTHWRLVGNPVRPSFSELDRSQALEEWGLNRELPTLLVFGGSQGAHTLNRAVRECFSQLGSFCNLIWGRGQRDSGEMPDWQGTGKLAVKTFIDNMPSAYAAADLAICRSGAMTLSELQAAALPALLVPFPYAAADHQKHNALAYAKKGGALVTEDREFNGARLLKEARELLQDTPRLQQMRQALRILPRQDAAEIIAEEVLRITKVPAD